MNVVAAPTAREICHSLEWYRHGRDDPTTWLGPTWMVRAMLTPDGPATGRLDWAGPPRVAAWGPGADWAAAALVAVAKVARHLWDWAALRTAPEVAAKLALVTGVGAWTIGTVLGPACGDDDAVAVGDYHLPHIVAWNLAGEPRADDRRMLELLEPYRPQRGRVLRLLGVAGRRPPAFGPRHRTLPMHRF